MSTQERVATGVSRGPGQALALELVRATEAAAIAAGRWTGRVERDSAKAAATGALRDHLMAVPMRGVVVAGEDELRGEDVGCGDGPVCDLAVLAGDGALSPVRDVPDSLAAVVVAERGALYDAPPDAVMEKLAVGPECADVVDIARPVAENLRAVAEAKDVRVSDVVVAVLNRSRHRELANEIRDAGARVHLLEGGEVAGAIAAARPESAIDLLMGTGGAAAGVLAAAALTCLGGALQARLRPEGFDTVLHTGDLVRGERVLFCATGVTTNELLRGVQHHWGRSTTQSMVLSSRPDTVRMVKSEHRFA
ncbi:fructose-bisphosphatase class II [Amycolatopsis sp. NPDC004378]